MAVAENIGCKNESCIKRSECKRALIYKDGTAVEIKSFGGTPQKGCGKFIAIKK